MWAVTDAFDNPDDAEKMRKATVARQEYVDVKGKLDYFTLSRYSTRAMKEWKALQRRKGVEGYWSMKITRKQLRKLIKEMIDLKPQPDSDYVFIGSGPSERFPGMRDKDHPFYAKAVFPQH